MISIVWFKSSLPWSEINTNRN